MSEQRVAIEIKDHVADVRMLRADRHNALDWQMFQGLLDAVRRLQDEETVRVVVLSGEGPSFCSGLDFPSFMSGDVPIDAAFEHSNPEDIANNAQQVAYGWQQLRMPVIAALQGVCYGGGCQLALGADIRIAAPDTKMSVMEIKYGLIPDMAITQTITRLTRLDVAKELTYTGRIVEAEEALRLGLVTRIEQDSRSVALELAATIAAKSPDATRGAKKLFNEAWLASPADGLALEESLQKSIIGQPNQMAAVQASMTRQPAVYKD